MPNGSASVDQSLFEEAITEVKRLEGLLVQRKEISPDAFSAKSLFEAQDTAAPSVVTWDKAYDDAMRIEQKLGYGEGKRMPSIQKPAVKAVTAEQHAATEHDELERMKARFAAEEEKMKAPAPAPPVMLEKPAAAKPVPIELPAPEAMQKPEPKPEPVAIPAVEEKPAAAKAEEPPAKAPPAASPQQDAEKLRLMRERLSTVINQQKAVAPPAAPQAPAKAAGKPKRTLFDMLEERKAQATPAVSPVQQARPAEPAPRPAPRPLTGIAAQIDEEKKRKTEMQSQRIDALKRELAEKVRKRKEEEERKKNLEDLGNTYEGKEE